MQVTNTLIAVWFLKPSRTRTFPIFRSTGCHAAPRRAGNIAVNAIEPNGTSCKTQRMSNRMHTLYGIVCLYTLIAQAALPSCLASTSTSYWITCHADCCSTGTCSTAVFSPLPIGTAFITKRSSPSRETDTSTVHIVAFLISDTRAAE
jgi:hypothetical protein